VPTRLGFLLWVLTRLCGYEVSVPAFQKARGLGTRMIVCLALACYSAEHFFLKLSPQLRIQAS